MKFTLAALPLLASVAVAMNMNMDSTSLASEASAAGLNTASLASKASAGGINLSSAASAATSAVAAAGGTSGAVAAAASSFVAANPSLSAFVASVQSVVATGGAAALEGLATDTAVQSVLMANPQLAQEATALLGASGAQSTDMSSSDMNSMSGAPSALKAGGLLVALAGVAAGAAIVF